MRKIFTIFLMVVSVITFGQEGMRLKTNMYRDILSFVLKASDIDTVGNGLEKIGFDNTSKTTSNDGKFLNNEYEIPGNEKIIVTRYKTTGLVYKVYLIHQMDIFNFITNELDESANIYKPNQIWYNKNRNIAFTYTINDNIVAVLELLAL